MSGTQNSAPTGDQIKVGRAMSGDGAFQLAEAFTESSDDDRQTIVTVEELDSPPDAPSAPQSSALQTTLGVASSAASLVLFPYVFAGKAAIQATSMAVAAPRAITTHVKNSISQSWTHQADDQTEDQTDLFGEHSRLSTSSTSSLSSTSSELFDDQTEPEEHKPGVVSQLLTLPVRMVHRGVSTAVAIPTRVVTYSGRKIHTAVTTSQQLATTAVVASTGAVARTGVHVARGITHGAVSTVSFTASTISGAVGASARTVSYVIPPSVSNAVWRGVDATGNVSVNVLAHAIAVPSYRMARTLVPAVGDCFSEEDCVNETRAAVKMLVKVLGPQNAFYLLKSIYETVNSEEAHDALLLCRDLLHESLDGQNYKKAGASVGEATGITKVVYVVKEAYSVLPSFDELRDAAALVADVSDEVIDSVTHVVSPSSDEEEGVFEGEDNPPRFEYLDDDDESVDDKPVGRIFTSEAFERQRSSSSSDEEMNPILASGISLLTRVCDSEEASSLFNTFGDFLDVLVD